MNRTPISRRTLLFSAAAATIGCTQKATGFPGYCFVANQGGRNITAVDMELFRVRKSIPLDAAPAVMIANPDPQFTRVYALAPEGGTVYEVHPGNLAISRRSTAGPRAVDMRLARDGRALWVLYREPAALVEFPLATLKPGRRIALPAPPDCFELSDDGRAAIASRQARSLTVVSLSRAAIERTFPTGVELNFVRFRKDGQMLMAGSTADRSLIAFDPAAGRSIVRLPLPLAPRQIASTADGGQIFVTGDGVDAVVIAFPYTTEIDQTLLAGHAPGAMMVTDTSPSYLLVANPESNNMTVIDIDTRRLVAIVQVGQGPRQILMTPDNQYALTLNEKSGDMGVVRLATFTETWVRRYRSASLFTLIAVGDRPVAAAVVRVR